MKQLKRLGFLASLLFLNFISMAQENTAPYQTIESYPESYNAATVVSRMIDGLGYRYHWASKDLREEDLAFEPGNDGKTTLETIKHIFELSEDVFTISEAKEFKRPRVKVAQMDYHTLRFKTLTNLYNASQNFRKMSDADISTLQVVFVSEAGKKEFDFWHFLNGQLSDAIYHTGQLVSFRRSAGNPVSKEMNVFTGGM